MEQYYKIPVLRDDATQTAGVNSNESHDDNHAHIPDSVQLDFDQYHRTLVAQELDEGWWSEKRCYLKDMPPNVSRDTDILKWWQV